MCIDTIYSGLCAAWELKFKLDGGQLVHRASQSQSTGNMYLFLAVRLQEKALFQCSSSEAQNKPQICSRFEPFLALPEGDRPLFCFDFRRVHVKHTVDRISLRIE